MARTLRDYQTNAINSVVKNWIRYNRVIMVMPTGAGKSFTMFSLIENLVKEGANVVMAVKKRNLVYQLEEDAKAFGLSYGVYMAGEERNNNHVQICSIDTLHSRNDYPFVDRDNVFLFIDECDESNNDSYHTFRAAYPQAKELGVTATAYNNLSFYDIAVEPTDAQKLTDEGVLTPVVYYAPKKRIDTLKLSIKNGDFDKAEIDQATVIGDILENWLLYGDNRQTMIFANNVKKSKEICQAFNEAGIKAAHCDANTPEEERKKIINDFRKGIVKILCNVKLFTRGTNIIEIGCMIDAAPTTSLNLYIQKVGRGVRSNPFYKDLIFIDHAGNCLNHGAFTDKREVNLSEPIKFTRANLIERMRICPSCFRAFSPADLCPYCGANTAKKKLYKTKNLKGEMVEVSEEEFNKIRIIKEYKKSMWEFINYKIGERFPDRRGEVHTKLLDKYGFSEIIKVKEEIKLKKWHVIRWLKANGKGYMDLDRWGLK